MTLWPYRDGFLNRADMPNIKTGQPSFIKHLSEQWAEPFRSTVQSIPRDAKMRPIEIAD
jgi:hypothetical protein